VPDPIKAMEMMNQLNLGYGNEPEFKKKSVSNNPKVNPEKAAEFRQALETEKEANRVLKEMKRDQAIEKAREFVKEGKSVFEPKSGGGGGGGGGGGSMTDPMERKAKPYNRAKGGIVKSASKRADGCAIRGKTRA
jgi:hypothetical protein